MGQHPQQPRRGGVDGKRENLLERVHPGARLRQEAREPWRVERGEKALDLMQSALSGHEFLAAGVFTIADVALLAYTRLAREGGFDLSTRPAVMAWIARCETALSLAPATE